MWDLDSKCEVRSDPSRDPAPASAPPRRCRRPARHGLRMLTPPLRPTFSPLPIATTRFGSTPLRMSCSRARLARSSEAAYLSRRPDRRSPRRRSSCWRTGSSAPCSRSGSPARASACRPAGPSAPAAPGTRRRAPTSFPPRCPTRASWAPPWASGAAENGITARLLPTRPPPRSCSDRRVRLEARRPRSRRPSSAATAAPASAPAGSRAARTRPAIGGAWAKRFVLPQRLSLHDADAPQIEAKESAELDPTPSLHVLPVFPRGVCRRWPRPAR